MRSTQRAALFAGLALAVGCYYAWSRSLWNASTWWDVAWVSLVLVPAVFGFVYLALPLRGWRGNLPLGLALVLVTWGLEEAGLHALADFGKLAAATLLGFWFITLFETLGLVVFVALLAYIVIIASKLQRLEAALTELAERVRVRG